MAQGSRTFRKGELLSILGEIYRDKATGTLVLQRDQTNKFLYVQDGDFIFAASNAGEDKFTQILVERGKLTPEQLTLATEKKEGRTIGRTLVEMGFLGSEDLLDALVEQMRKIARSAVQWDEGLAVFKSDVLPPNIARLPLSTPRFLVDTALSIDDRAWAATTLGRMETAIVISPAEREVARALPATSEEIRLLEQVDGKRNAREVCERAGVDSFYGARFFLGLSNLGLLHLAPVMVQSGSSKVQSESLDLSFLDDIAPPSQAPPPSAPPAPAAVPVRPSSANPWSIEDERPASAAPAAQPAPAAPEPGLPFEAVAPVPAQSVQSSRLTPATRPGRNLQTPPDLLPPPSDMPLVQDETGGASSLEDIGERTARRGFGRVLAALAVLAIVGVLGAAGWYFFLRPSDMIPVEPSRPASRPKATPQARSEPPAAIPMTPKADVQATAPAPAGAPVQVADAPPSSPGPSAIAAPRPPLAQPPAVSPAPSSRPAAGKASQLLASGAYSDAARESLAAWQNSPSGYTVLIEVACQADTVAKGLAAAAGRSDYAILPFDLKGRACFLVVWGDYPDKASAEEALRGLPAFFLKAAQPRVVARAKVLDLSRANKP